MNTAKNIDLKENNINLTSKLILSENFILRMKQLNHEWLSILLESAWIKQWISIPKNVPVEKLVDAIKINNPLALERIKQHLESRKIDENKIFCISIGQTGYKQKPQKTFFYSIWVEEWKHNILREIDPLKIPEFLQSYINWNSDIYITKEIEKLHNECVKILNSLISTSQEIDKAKQLLQMIFACVYNQDLNNTGKEYFVIWWNIAIETTCSEIKLKIISNLQQRAQLYETDKPWNKKILSKAWTIKKKKEPSSWKLIKIY